MSKLKGMFFAAVHICHVSLEDYEIYRYILTYVSRVYSEKVN